VEGVMGLGSIFSHWVKRVDAQRKADTRADLLYRRAANRIIPVTLKQLKESFNLVMNSKNIDTRIRRCKFVIERAQFLYDQYESMGIHISEPNMKAVADKFREHLIDLEKEKASS